MLYSVAIYRYFWTTHRSYLQVPSSPSNFAPCISICRGVYTCRILRHALNPTLPNIWFGTNKRSYALHHPRRRHPGASVLQQLQKFLHETQSIILKACVRARHLTLTLLTWRIWPAPTNAIKWQMGFNSAFKGLRTVQTPANEDAIIAAVAKGPWERSRDMRYSTRTGTVPV